MALQHSLFVLFMILISFSSARGDNSAIIDGESAISLEATGDAAHTAPGIWAGMSSQVDHSWDFVKEHLPSPYEHDPFSLPLARIFSPIKDNPLEMLRACQQSKRNGHAEQNRGNLLPSLYWLHIAIQICPADEHGIPLYMNYSTALSRVGRYQAAYASTAKALKLAVEMIEESEDQGSDEKELSLEQLEEIRLNQIDLLLLGNRLNELQRVARSNAVMLRDQPQRAARLGISTRLISEISNMLLKVREFVEWSNSNPVETNAPTLNELREKGAEALSAQAVDANLVVVSLYPDDYIHQESVNVLRASLERLNLPYDIVSYPPQKEGSSTSSKPDFIKQQMEKHKKPILYVEPTMEFLRFPSLLSPSSESAEGTDTSSFQNVDWAIPNALKLSPELKTTLSAQHQKDMYRLIAFGQVVYFNNTTGGRRTLECWRLVQNYDDNLSKKSDSALELAWNSFIFSCRHEANVAWLPWEYTTFFPHPAFSWSTQQRLSTRTVLLHDGGRIPSLRMQDETLPAPDYNYMHSGLGELTPSHTYHTEWKKD